MELLKVITHAAGGKDYVRNAVNYVLDERSTIVKGNGVNPDDASAAITAFDKNAEFWNNQDKNQLLHTVLSFTKKTAPTVERAMKLCEEVLEPYTTEHLSLGTAHEEEHADSLFHVHELIGTTNYNTGAMLYADNRTTFAMAQRMADVTNQPVRLVVKSDNDKEWECKRIFTPED
ncbi:MAG: relaxase/mobilization nuclease domain-containing protein [Ruminococcus sp.]|nr:relaxase/mobilization nuclease domain-containing protein [Ruminococcus sp.]